MERHRRGKGQANQTVAWLGKKEEYLGKGRDMLVTCEWEHGVRDEEKRGGSEGHKTSSLGVSVPQMGSRASE